MIEISEEAIKDGYEDVFVIECYTASLVATEKYEKAYKFLKDKENQWRESARTNAFYALCISALFGDIDKANSYNLRAYDLSPSNVQIKWNLGLTQLRMGNLKEGIENYKIRFEWDKFPSPRRKFHVAKWDENVDKNSKILIWTEQGIADDLLFCTAIKDFKKIFPI